MAVTRELYYRNQPQVTSSRDIFGHCVDDIGTTNDTIALMQCITNELREDDYKHNADIKTFLLVVAGAMTFFFAAGFSMLGGGSVRHKNLQNTMLMTILNVCGSAIAFWSVGFAFAFGGDNQIAVGTASATVLGTKNFFSVGSSPAFWFFEYALSSMAVTVVSGTLAERCQMTAYICYAVLISGFVYPVVAHSIWSHSGFLSHTLESPLLSVGVLDFAGGGVVHTTGGIIALCASVILGPRQGRFYDERGELLEIPKEFPGHSLALQLLGTVILWFGWFGRNPGSALVLHVDDVGEVAASAAISTALCGASGGIAALMTNMWLEERRTGEPTFSLTVCMNGALSGLVAATAGAAVIESWAAVVVGIFSAWIYIGGSNLLIKYCVDDVIDAIPTHLFNGIWGMLSTGLFASPNLLKNAYGHDDHPGLFYSIGGRNGVDFTLLAAQFIGILFIIGWCAVTTSPFFLWMNYMGIFRSDTLEEMIGLDRSYHGTVAEDSSNVKREYYEAYKRNREKKIRSRMEQRKSSSRRGGSAFDRQQNDRRSAVESYYSENEIVGTIDEESS